MKTKIMDYKVFTENEFENRINFVVKYQGHSYAVSITCYHDFDKDHPIIMHLNSFKYLSNIKRTSQVRDREIKRAIIGFNYNY